MSCFFFPCNKQKNCHLCSLRDRPSLLKRQDRFHTLLLRTKLAEHYKTDNYFITAAINMRGENSANELLKFRHLSVTAVHDICFLSLHKLASELFGMYLLRCSHCNDIRCCSLDTRYLVFSPKPFNSLRFTSFLPWL